MSTTPDNVPTAARPPVIDPASLAPGTVVEVNRSYLVVIVGNGQWRTSAHGVGADEWPAEWRITRVFEERRPPIEFRYDLGGVVCDNSAPGLFIARVQPEPSPIRPEDVKVGMVVERRNRRARYRDEVTDTLLGDPHEPRLCGTDDGEDIWWPRAAESGWSLWLIEDAPEPVDPDADLITTLDEMLGEDSWEVEAKCRELIAAVRAFDATREATS